MALPCSCPGPCNSRDEADAFDVLSPPPSSLHRPAYRPILTSPDSAVRRKPVPVKPKIVIGRGLPLQTGMKSPAGHMGASAARDLSVQYLPALDVLEGCRNTWQGARRRCVGVPLLPAVARLRSRGAVA